MTDPRVSVVVPTYNRGGLLVEAVESALAQTFGDLEVLVVDDGSDDGSADAVAELRDPRVVVLTLGHSGIPAVARNAALARARGEYVAFLDSDDVWHPDKLSHQVPVLDDHAAVGLVCSNARVIGENGDEIRTLYLRPEQGASGNVLGALLEVNFVIVSSALARRKLVEETGCFTQDPTLRGVEDYDLWLRLGSVAEIAFLPEPLLDYREHGGGLRLGVPRATYWNSLLGALDNLQRFRADDGSRGALLRRRRAELLVELARAQRSELGSGAALRSLRDAARVDAATVARRLLPSPLGSLRGVVGSVRAAAGKASRAA